MGFIAFALSFIPPGINAFCVTPELTITSLFQGFEDGEWQRVVFSIALGVGWLANFTIFFRLPSQGAWVSIALPWILYLGVLFFDYSRSVETHWPDTFIMTFIPFYPWALGIGLIHCSRLFEPIPKESPRSPWTGF
jgi:hypothetical protein